MKIKTIITILFFLPVLAFSQPSEDTIAQEVPEQKEQTAPLPPQEVESPQDSTETGEFSEILAGLLDLWKDAKADYEEKAPQGTTNKIVWFVLYVIGLLTTIKGVYIVRSWNWLKRYFYQTDIKTIVIGVSLLVSGLLTFLTTGGHFDAQRFAMISTLLYLLSDPAYNVLVTLGWIKKTPKVPEAVAV